MEGILYTGATFVVLKNDHKAWTLGLRVLIEDAKTL
jgi:hypothetical protein